MRREYDELYDFLITRTEKEFTGNWPWNTFDTYETEEDPWEAEYRYMTITARWYSRQIKDCFGDLW